MSQLKKYRLINNYTQKEMALKLNISVPAYWNYESGKRIMPANVLIKFLELRGEKEDLKLAKILKEF